jgi:ribonuclease P/MRP protein subunit RPP1
MKFLDLHVHSSLSTGRDTPEKMVRQAKALGSDIGLCDGVKGDYPSGIEIHARGKKELKAKLGQKFDYTLVRGGDYNINRLAVADKRVDILAHPDLGRRDSGVDSVIARAAGENKVAIEVNLGRVINSWGLNRVYVIRNIRRNLILARKYSVPLVATTGAKSFIELRGCEGVHHLLRLMGFEEEEIIDAMYEVPVKILGGGLKSR